MFHELQVAGVIIGARNANHVGDLEKVFSFEMDDGKSHPAVPSLAAWAGLSSWAGEPFVRGPPAGAQLGTVMHAVCCRLQSGMAVLP